jgi:hypothetical protein
MAKSKKTSNSSKSVALPAVPKVLVERDKKPPNPKKSGTGLKWTIICAAVAAFLFLIANSALWFSRNLFSTQTFTTMASEAILSESSRQAVADKMAQQIFADRPILRRVAEEPATKLISGLLGTEAADKIFNRAVTRLHTTMTSQNPQSVEIDLSGIKGTIERVLDVARDIGNVSPEEEKIDASKIPDKIVLLDADKVPNIYNAGVIILWLGPLAFIGAVLLLATPFWRNRNNKAAWQKLFLIEAGIIAIAGFLALIIGPLFKPAVLARVSDSDFRIVVENIYNTFVGSFNDQSTTFFVVIILLLCAGAVFMYITRKSALKRS